MPSLPFRRPTASRHAGTGGGDGASLRAQAEAFRMLRSNLLVALGDAPGPTVLVTSAYAGEGKTSVTANLAVSLVSAGKRVGLLDLDLRRPGLHDWFGVPNDAGAADVLLGQRTLQECLQELQVGSPAPGGRAALHFLPAGQRIEQPAELLSSDRVLGLLEAVVHLPSAHDDEPELLDIILIDTPPVLQVADALVIGRVVPMALLVAEAGSTRAVAVQRAKEALLRNETDVLGVVMNSRSASTSPEAAGYSYGYG